MADSAIDPTTVGAFVTIILAFLGIAKIMLNQATKDREADRGERLKLTMAIEHMAENSKKIADATRKAAEEAKERNGHLGEQSLKLAALVTAQNQDVKEVKNNTAKISTTLSKSALIAAEDRDMLNPQVVHEQTVEHQIVKNKE